MKLSDLNLNDGRSHSAALIFIQVVALGNLFSRALDRVLCRYEAANVQVLVQKGRAVLEKGLL